jgi:hypothetical protein
MRRIAVTILLAITAAPFAACLQVPHESTGVPPQSESAFLSNFSFRDSIRKNLPETAKSNVQGEACSSSIAAARRVYHCDDSAILYISATDETSFMQAFRAAIEQSIRDSGANLQGSSGIGGLDSFAIHYTDEKVSGWLDVCVFRGQGDESKLVLIANES